MVGRITDKQSGNALEGVAVSCKETTKLSVTDEFGRYQLDLPVMADSVNLYFYVIGYVEESIRASFRPGMNELDYALQPDPNIIDEVVIQGNMVLSDKLHSPQMSISTLTAKEAKALPALFGEVDLIKLLQLKPGIIPGPEGTTGLFVRGGNSDQNLMLLDDAVVYNANHLFGFFSTFNPDAVEDVTVYKGG
ncbi:MAG: carboxypeptidase-like regulatory domain-containing protein, partial [Saprospiraceae bacterium]